VNNSPPPSPADRLTDLSHRLGEGADAWGAENEGRWLVAPLIALIVSFIKEIAESLASLAALIRDGKLVPVPPAAPRQGIPRPAGKPNTPASRSPWPAPAEAEQLDVPPAEPEMAAMPAVSPGPESPAPRPTGRMTGAKRAPAPRAGTPAPAAKIPNPSPVQRPFPGLSPTHWPRVHPNPKTARPKPAPWHVHFVTLTK
jgi:hypothetical protein